jgi:hypothetical protein
MGVLVRVKDGGVGGSMGKVTVRGGEGSWCLGMKMGRERKAFIFDGWVGFH